MIITISLILCIAISSFAALLFIARGQPLIPCTIRIVPTAGSDVQVCTEFRVDVNIEDFYQFPVWDYEFLLTYDSTQMTPTLAADGDFLIEPVTFWYDDTIPGQVFCQGYSTLGGATGSGTLASVWFHCDNAGDSTLDLEIVYISDQAGNLFIPDTVIPASIHQYDIPPAFVSLDPATYTVPICVPFTVNVMVQDVIDLYAYDLKLSYTNTAVVDAIDIWDAGFIPAPIIETHEMIDDASGLIEYGAMSMAPVGADGSGAIATIQFHCTGAGESILNIDDIQLFDSAGALIPKIVMPQGRVIQQAYWEPVKLIDIVEWPGRFSYVPLPGYIPLSPPGYHELMNELMMKGYLFDDPTLVDAIEVHGTIEEEEFMGTVASWWSSNTLEDGTRACMLSAEMDDGTSMAMAFVTNLLPPEQVPEVDPYIIVNAQPYLFIRYYWWAWPTTVYPLGRIITWSYWWYDSHSHPNWFWGPYWWWRIHVKAHFLGMPYPPVDVNWVYWRPWWGWWWHWTYWRHWYWWSTYFPYDP